MLKRDGISVRASIQCKFLDCKIYGVFLSCLFFIIYFSVNFLTIPNIKVKIWVVRFLLEYKLVFFNIGISAILPQSAMPTLKMSMRNVVLRLFKFLWPFSSMIESLCWTVCQASLSDSIQTHMLFFQEICLSLHPVKGIPFQDKKQNFNAHWTNIPNSMTHPCCLGHIINVTAMPRLSDTFRKPPALLFGRRLQDLKDTFYQSANT